MHIQRGDRIDKTLGVFSTIETHHRQDLQGALPNCGIRAKKEKIADYLSQIIRYTAIVSLPMLVFAVLIPEQILSILTPDAYTESGHYLPILSLSFLAFRSGVPTDHQLLAAGKTRTLFIIDTTMAMANIILN